MRTLLRCLGLSFVIAVAGCATATIESSWHAPASPHLTNVVTLSTVSDPGLRRTAEDQLTAQLQHHGIHAVSGYMVLNDQDLADHSRIASTLQAQGFDGVVGMRFVSASQKLAYYPGFDTYWGYGWGAGGEVVPETVVRIEVNAYSLASNQLVFSAMSKSVDPDSARDLIASVSKITTDRLAKDRVIGRAQTTTMR